MFISVWIKNNMLIFHLPFSFFLKVILPLVSNHHSSGCRVQIPSESGSITLKDEDSVSKG